MDSATITHRRLYAGNGSFFVWGNRRLSAHLVFISAQFKAPHAGQGHPQQGDFPQLAAYRIARNNEFCRTQPAGNNRKFDDSTRAPAIRRFLQRSHVGLWCFAGHGLSGTALPLGFPHGLFVSINPAGCQGTCGQPAGYIRHVTHRALAATLAFGSVATVYFLFFGKETGQWLYGSDTAGFYLQLLAPLVILMYLDGVVDAILKGMDQQFSSFKYNVTDSSIRVILVAFLLPRFGLSAYICILFFSTIFNASLSIHRLLKVTELKINLLHDLILPLTGSATVAFLIKSFLLLIK